MVEQYEPSVEQWARAEALREARKFAAWVVPDARGALEEDLLDVIDRATLRWAKLIETGEVDD